jgi:hypothetical protein
VIGDRQRAGPHFGHRRFVELRQIECDNRAASWIRRLPGILSIYDDTQEIDLRSIGKVC